MTNGTARALPKHLGRALLAVGTELAGALADLPLVARTIAADCRLIIAGSRPAAAGRL
jgi:hypothetical protein